jgi:hypothetical protein
MGLGKALFRAVTLEAVSNIKPIRNATGSLEGGLGGSIPVLDQHAIDYNKAVAKFRRTYNGAMERGSVSDKQILKMTNDVAAMEASGLEIVKLLSQGGAFTGKGIKYFQVPDLYRNPAHYRVPVIEETLDLSKGAKGNTPPDALDIGNGFATLDKAAYQDSVRVGENSLDPGMGNDYREGAANSSKDAAQAQSIHNTVSNVSYSIPSIPEAAIPLTKEVVERVSTNTTGVVNGVLARTMSSNAELGHRIGDYTTASLLTNNGAQGVFGNAINYKGVVKEQATLMLVELSDSISRVIKGNMFDSLNKWKAKQDTALKVNRDLTEHLLINAQEFDRGLPLSTHIDPVIQQLADTHRNSGFNEYMHKRLKDAGHEPDKLNPSKIPATFLFHEVSKFIEKDIPTDIAKITKEEFYLFMGNQLVNGHPVLGRLDVDRRVLGKIFYDKLEHNGRHGGKARYQPLAAGEDIANKITGNMAKDINKALNKLFVNDGALSPSFKWDFKQRLIGKSGAVVTLTDFLDIDVIGNLRRQAERVSGVYGTAQAGFTVPALLDDLPKEVRDSFVDADGQALAEAAVNNKLKIEYQVPVNSEARLNRFLEQFSEGISDPQEIQKLDDITDNVVHAIMGRAVGESIPALLTAASSLGSLTKLAMSAVYNINDQGKMYQSLGALNVLGTTFATIPSGKMWRYIGGKMTKEEAKDSLALILALQKSKDVHINGIDDFFNNPAYHNSRFLATIAYMAQGTPLWNLSEYVRRHQLYIVAQILDTEMVKLAKGGKGNKSLHAALKRSGIDDTTIELWGEAITKFGRDTRKWSPEYRPNRFEVEMSGLMDSIITKVKKGDNPEWFEKSSVAKAIFPFMAVQFALTNTLLRNTLNQGATATLELLAYQAPFALAAVYLREIIAGRNPEDLTTKQLIFSYLSVLPTLGAFGILANLANQSGGGRGAQTSALGLTYVNDVAKSTDNLIRGTADISDIYKLVPGLSINPILKGLVNAVVKP